MKEYSRGHVDIDLDAIAENFENMHKNLKAGTLMTAVVKVDGYGHGAVPICAMLEEYDYIWGYAVATAEEAMELRCAGRKKPILILGYTFPESYEEIVRWEIRPTIFTLEMAKALSEEAVRQQKEVYFHVALDTGMGRIGYRRAEALVADMLQMQALPGATLEGVFTHFANADTLDKENALEQLRKYHELVAACDRAGVHFKLHHASNSAGIVEIPEANLNMVRAGITLYGLWPSDEVCRNIVPLKPALSLKSHIAYIKEVEPGSAISYGSTWTAEKTTRIATIPLGYGDGYPRSLSNKGWVLIRGKKAKICGRVCMDQLMVDVTGISEAVTGDPVTLIGTDGECAITAEELGDLSGRFNYELVCDLNKRLPRIYYRAGKRTEVMDYFEK